LPHLPLRLPLGMLHEAAKTETLAFRKTTWVAPELPGPQNYTVSHLLERVSDIYGYQAPRRARSAETKQGQASKYCKRRGDS